MIIQFPPDFQIAYSPDIQRKMRVRLRWLRATGRYLNPRRVVLTMIDRERVARGVKP